MKIVREICAVKRTLQKLCPLCRVYLSAVSGELLCAGKHWHDTPQLAEMGAHWFNYCQYMPFKDGY